MQYALLATVFFLAVCVVALYAKFSLEAVLDEQALTRLQGLEINLQDAAEFRRVVDKVLLVSCALALVVAVLCFAFYRRIKVSLEEIRHRLEHFSRTSFDDKLPEYDIKEINELAKTIDEMLERLKHSEQVRIDFVANVSHELKTPVTSIKGFVETLIQGAKDNEKDLNRFLDIVLKQADRLDRIVSDLLTLARLEGEQRDELLSLEEEFVITILRAAIANCRARLEEKNIRIEYQCDDRLMMTCDRFLIEQAITNLVDNAIKYSGQDSFVHLTAKVDNHEVVIDVEDKGLGIPREHLPRLFERFYRVDKARSRSIGGTGLGLAIVKHIVQVHGGRVSVESHLGMGSRFSIAIPLDLARK